MFYYRNREKLNNYTFENIVFPWIFKCLEHVIDSNGDGIKH